MEIRELIEREKLQAFVIPMGIGVIFLGLWFWAKKAPLRALVTALALFVTVHAVDALVDPKALMRGVILKVLVIAGLAGGIKAALEIGPVVAERERGDA